MKEARSWKARRAWRAEIRALDCMKACAFCIKGLSFLGQVSAYCSLMTSEPAWILEQVSALLQVVGGQAVDCLVFFGQAQMVKQSPPKNREDECCAGSNTPTSPPTSARTHQQDLALHTRRRSSVAGLALGLSHASK